MPENINIGCSGPHVGMAPAELSGGVVQPARGIRHLEDLVPC